MLHNFCLQNRVPILDGSVPVPNIAMVDDHGVLVDDIRRHHTMPTADWRRRGCGSALRSLLVQEIAGNDDLLHNRNR